MEVLKAATVRQRAHGDVISLCAGQPSSPAPRVVLEAAVAAMSRDVLGYTDTPGIPALRQAIASHYAEAYGLDVTADEVVVTTGSSGGLTALFLAAFDTGDTVVMTRPGYPAYRNTLLALGCDVREVDSGDETRFQLTVGMLESLPSPPAGVIVASPANPTGTIIDATELAAIAQWCREHGCLLISDEIYHGISYGRPCASVKQFSPDAVAVGSFSKYYSMTGWRVGWLVLPPDLVRPVEVLLGNLSLCPPAISQHAALAAFGPEATAELDGHVRRYSVNRDILLRRLPELGLTHFAPPDGAFYAYADVRHLTADSLSWCAQVLDRTGVALTPGVDFAPADPDHPTATDGTGTVRLSFAGSPEELDEALDRLVAFVG